MGSAAYRRGSACIARQLAADQRPVEFEMMQHLNALPKYPDAGRPFGPVELVAAHGGWWVACPTTGFGFWYPTLHEAVRRWHVDIVGFAHGVWQATPRLRGSG